MSSELLFNFGNPMDFLWRSARCINCHKLENEVEKTECKFHKGPSVSWVYGDSSYVTHGSGYTCCGTESDAPCVTNPKHNFNDFLCVLCGEVLVEKDIHSELEKAQKIFGPYGKVTVKVKGSTKCIHHSGKCLEVWDQNGSRREYKTSNWSCCGKSLTSDGCEASESHEVTWRSLRGRGNFRHVFWTRNGDLIAASADDGVYVYRVNNKDTNENKKNFKNERKQEDYNTFLKNSDVKVNENLSFSFTLLCFLPGAELPSAASVSNSSNPFSPLGTKLLIRKKATYYILDLGKMAAEMSAENPVNIILNNMSLTSFNLTQFDSLYAYTWHESGRFIMFFGMEHFRDNPYILCYDIVLKKNEKVLMQAEKSPELNNYTILIPRKIKQPVKFGKGNKKTNQKATYESYDWKLSPGSGLCTALSMNCWSFFEPWGSHLIINYPPFHGASSAISLLFKIDINKTDEESGNTSTDSKTTTSPLITLKLLGTELGDCIKSLYWLDKRRFLGEVVGVDDVASIIEEYVGATPVILSTDLYRRSNMQLSIRDHALNKILTCHLNKDLKKKDVFLLPSDLTHIFNGTQYFISEVGYSTFESKNDNVHGLFSLNPFKVKMVEKDEDNNFDKNNKHLIEEAETTQISSLKDLSTKKMRGHSGAHHIRLVLMSDNGELISLRNGKFKPFDTFQFHLDKNFNKFSSAEKTKVETNDEKGSNDEEKDADMSLYSFLQSAEDGDLQSVKRYLSKGHDVNERESFLSPTTALGRACKYGHYTIAKFLIDAEADINLTCGKRNSYEPVAPLHWAVCLGTDSYGSAKNVNIDLDLVKLLLENGADVHLADKFGGTPLYHLCDSLWYGEEKQAGSANLAKLLIEEKADVNVKGLMGRCLERAKQNHNQPLISYLESQNAK